jgi:hypothetical protein
VEQVGHHRLACDAAVELRPGDFQVENPSIGGPMLPPPVTFFR